MKVDINMYNFVTLVKNPDLLTEAEISSLSEEDHSYW